MILAGFMVNAEPRASIDRGGADPRSSVKGTGTASTASDPWSADVSVNAEQRFVDAGIHASTASEMATQLLDASKHRVYLLATQAYAAGFWSDANNISPLIAPDGKHVSAEGRALHADLAAFYAGSTLQIGLAPVNGLNTSHSRIGVTTSEGIAGDRTALIAINKESKVRVTTLARCANTVLSTDDENNQPTLSASGVDLALQTTTLDAPSTACTARNSLTFEIKNEGTEVSDGEVTVTLPMNPRITDAVVTASGWSLTEVGTNYKITRSAPIGARERTSFVMSFTFSSLPSDSLTSNQYVFNATLATGSGGDTTPANNAYATTLEFTACPPPDLVPVITLMPSIVDCSKTVQLWFEIRNLGAGASHGPITVTLPTNPRITGAKLIPVYDIFDPSYTYDSDWTMTEVGSDYQFSSSTPIEPDVVSKFFIEFTYTALLDDPQELSVPLDARILTGSGGDASNSNNHDQEVLLAFACS
ncbi:hypothetical protein C6I20_14540 [Aeromicrobium sp. A1-2]|nr:hypothetical protein C6I20_14540 [Aeromicrobium sp. A1-2]